MGGSGSRSGGVGRIVEGAVVLLVVVIAGGLVRRRIRLGGVLRHSGAAVVLLLLLTDFHAGSREQGLARQEAREQASARRGMCTAASSRQ